MYSRRDNGKQPAEEQHQVYRRDSQRRDVRSSSAYEGPSNQQFDVTRMQAEGNFGPRPNISNPLTYMSAPEGGYQFTSYTQSPERSYLHRTPMYPPDANYPPTMPSEQPSEHPLNPSDRVAMSFSRPRGSNLYRPPIPRGREIIPLSQPEYDMPTSSTTYTKRQGLYGGQEFFEANYSSSAYNDQVASAVERENAPQNNFVRPEKTYPYSHEGKKLIVGEVGTMSCLVSSTAMVLSDHGSDMSRQEIEKGLNHQIEKGTSWRSAEKFLNDAGYNYSNSYIRSEDTLRSALRQGSCILQYKLPGYEIGHTVVADRIDERGWVAIRDPNRNVGAVTYHYSDVEKFWTGAALVPTPQRESSSSQPSGSGYRRPTRR